MTIRYLDGVTEPIVEVARVLRTADWAADRSDDDIRRALANSAIVASAWDGDCCLGLLRVIGDGA